MKALLFYCALLAGPARVAPATPAPALAPPTTKVAVLFTRQTTFADLAATRQSLLTSDGIVLTYDRLEFSPGGELLRIAFRVDCRDGYQGSASSDDLPGSTGPGKPFGFVRDYTRGAKTPFRVGVL